MIINRIGDFGLAIAIFTLYFYFKTLDYGVIFALVPHFVEYSIYFFEYKMTTNEFMNNYIINKRFIPNYKHLIAIIWLLICELSLILALDLSLLFV